MTDLQERDALKAKLAEAEASLKKYREPYGYEGKRIEDERARAEKAEAETAAFKDKLERCQEELDWQLSGACRKERPTWAEWEALKAAHEQSWQEREARWVAKLDYWQKRAEKAKAEYTILREANDRRQVKQFEAETEAAALRQALERIVENRPNDYPAVHIADEALSQPGPGAALLERVQKLEAVYEAARHATYVGYHDDMAKALAALDAPAAHDGDGDAD